MAENDKFETFMQRVMQRPLPTNPMARMRILARETALGVLEGVWPVHDFINDSRRLYKIYLEQRWNNDSPDMQIVIQNGYFSHSRGLNVDKSAFDLVGEIEPAEIFISYRRKDSSAFALLVLSRLKEFDLNAFLDLSLKPGDNWHAYIKEQIQERDYFIILLGQETLKSEVVKQEISWAIEAHAEIIPIWHNSFEFKQGAFELAPEIEKVLGSNHSIRVPEESALAYNNAIVELLNRFGVTP
jgi:hypothetical protein